MSLVTEPKSTAKLKLKPTPRSPYVQRIDTLPPPPPYLRHQGAWQQPLPPYYQQPNHGYYHFSGRLFTSPLLSDFITPSLSPSHTHTVSHT